MKNTVEEIFKVIARANWERTAIRACRAFNSVTNPSIPKSDEDHIKDARRARWYLYLIRKAESYGVRIRERSNGKLTVILD